MAALTSPREIEAFRLKAARAAIHMEALGMRNSHGNITPAWRKFFGLRPRAPHAAVIAEIDALIYELER
jgi:hypothetical protein